MVGLMVLVFAVVAVVIVGPVVAPAAVGLTKAVVLLLLVLGAVRLVLGVVRCVRAEPAARRNYPRAVLASILWHRHAAMLGLVSSDPSRRTKIRGAFGPSIGRNVRIERQKGRTRYPRARFTPDKHGFTVTVRTVPKVGRGEFEKAAAHLADVWSCQRVQISQPKPGRLIVRSLRTDPLAEPFGIEAAPAGTYEQPDVSRPYLGIDEWGQHRYLSLRNISGVVAGGLPGRGKTTLNSSLLWQWSGSPAVQFAIADGKGGGDYDDWKQRAWIYVPDDLEGAVSLLEDCHAEMRRRLRCVQAATGSRNAWQRGPTPDFPLLVMIMDECQHFLDLAAVKGDRNAEPLVRRCVALSAELIRKGRSVLVVGEFLTQKPTTDSVPSAIRDNSGISLSFGVKTIDAGIATLGPAIRDYPSSSPVGLQDDMYVGVMTTTLRTGQDPFTRVRVPLITEEAAAQRARATAHLRRNPGIALVADSPEREAS